LQAHISAATGAKQHLRPPVSSLANMTSGVKAGVERQQAAAGEIAESLSPRVNELSAHVDALGKRLKA